MKKLILISLLSIISSFSVLSLNKTALVIGNQNYSNMSKLITPKNEAILMKEALERLEFEVIIVLDGTEDGILDALYEFEDLLKKRGGLALFHYGGHGIQVNDSNYIIPVDARIPDERRVRTNAIDVDEVLGVMEMSGSQTNIVILDACRDNPLPSSSRSTARGLAVVANQPPDSIIVYSADAGTTAQDGLFTPTLLKYLEIPGMEFGDILKKVRKDVRNISNGKQRTGEYNQLESDIYLAGKEIKNYIDLGIEEVFGALEVTTEYDGDLYLNGIKVKSMNKGETSILSKLTEGSYKLEFIGMYSSESTDIAIIKSKTNEILISEKSIISIDSIIELAYVKAGTFTMGSTYGELDEKPKHNVTITKDFYIGRYEVTQLEWDDIMGYNPSSYKGHNLPVVNVSWHDAIFFCNKLSEIEGFAPAYIIKNDAVFWDKKSKGYRLPTESEWEFAARGGESTSGYTYAGSNNINNVAWYYKTTKDNGPEIVGSKLPNELGIYDMSGNVWEWCWDWKDEYEEITMVDPTGPESGIGKVLRGGSWLMEENQNRVTYRSYNDSYTKKSHIGFRIVKDL